MSAGVVSMALALKVSVPLVAEFSVVYVHLIWNSMISFLRPPYVYIIINGIIISIVASTRFQHKEADGYAEIPSATKIPEDVRYREIVPEFTIPESPVAHEQIEELIVSEVKAIEAINLQREEVIAPKAKAMAEVISQREEVIVPEVKVIEAISSVEAEAEDEDKFVISDIPPWKSPEKMKLPEKPLVSSRFGHRKSAKASPEGNDLFIYYLFHTTFKFCKRALDYLEIRKIVRIGTLRTFWSASGRNNRRCSQFRYVSPSL